MEACQLQNKSEQEQFTGITINDHDRLSELFRNDRLSFERVRKRLLEENIAAFPDVETRDKLILMQQRVEQILRGAGSGHNRFVMMQTLFWDHVVNIWVPALNGYSQSPTHEKQKPHFSLIHKNKFKLPTGPNE